MKFYLGIIFALCTICAEASVLPDFPFVAVTGQSSKQVAPDSAKLSFRISTFHQSSEVANAQLTQSANKVLALLKANGIADKQITAFELDKSEKRKRDDNYNELDILGYDLNRRFEVEISDLTKYPALMQQLYATDYVHELNTSFDTSSRDEVETALIGAAAAQAKKKAEQMAEGLGVKIHSVFAFNDSGSFTAFFATFGLDIDTGIRRRAPPNMSDAEAQQVLIPQSIEISKTVNVIYKITP
ncbi:MAG: SIMPL domain-containing protein [Rheinheimera sp.]|nr:SIMPL domain-containing protein [Rheinheimera sp.]